MSDVMKAEEAAIEKENWMINKMNDRSFIAEVAGMDPAAKQEYMDQLYRSYAGEDELVGEELMMAEELRNRQSQQGFSQGDVFVANVGGGLADAAGKFQAKGMRDDARAQKEDMNAAQQGGLEQTAQHMMNAQNAPAKANAQQQQNIISAEQQQAMIDALRLQKQEQQFGIAT